MGLEPTEANRDPVASEPILGLETTGAEPLRWEERTPLVLDPACRYCGEPSKVGEVFCERCGMRLPVVESARSLERASVRCPACGSPGQGETCSGCGGMLPPPEVAPLANRA